MTIELYEVELLYFWNQNLVYNTSLHHGLYISYRLLFYEVFVLGFMESC